MFQSFLLFSTKNAFKKKKKKKRFSPSQNEHTHKRLLRQQLCFFRATQISPQGAWPSQKVHNKTLLRQKPSARVRHKTQWRGSVNIVLYGWNNFGSVSTKSQNKNSLDGQRKLKRSQDVSSLTESNIFQGSRWKKPKGYKRWRDWRGPKVTEVEWIENPNVTRFEWYTVWQGLKPKKIQGVNGLNKVQGLRSLRIWQSPIVTKFEWFLTYLGATTFEWFEKVHTLQKVNGLRNNKGWMSWKYLSCTVRKSPTVTRSEWFVQSWKLQGLNGVHTSKRSQKLHCYQMFNGLNKSQRYKEVTMTHSHIRRMKAWPYRQECRGHDPTKKNLFCWWSLLIGPCIMSRDELRVQEKRREITHRLLLCWIHKFYITESSDSEQQPQRNRKPGGEQTGQGNQEKHQHPERKSEGYHSATVVPDSHPIVFSLVRGIRTQ